MPQNCRLQTAPFRKKRVGFPKLKIRERQKRAALRFPTWCCLKNWKHRLFPVEAVLLFSLKPARLLWKIRPFSCLYTSPVPELPAGATMGRSSGLYWLLCSSISVHSLPGSPDL